MNGLKAIVIGMFLMLISTIARAGHIECDINEINTFTNGSMDCAIGHTNNDFVSNPLQVNTDLMFGYSDWVFGLKYEYDNGQFQSGAIGFNAPYFGSFSYTPGNTNGTLTFSDTLDELFPNADDFMIVLKGGNSNTTQTNYVGYTLDSSNQQFTWDTPFFNPDENGLGNPKAISHFSFYGRGDSTFVSTCVGENCNDEPPVDVPEPGMVGLFALAGVLMYMRRRQKTT